MTRLFHVSSSQNRASITEHGLDWTRMGAARGIAGSGQPEVEGVFVCLDQSTVDFIVRINNTGGTVDVWAIDNAEEGELVDTPNGFGFLPRRVPPQDLELVQPGLPPAPAPHATAPASNAYQSTFTITLQDGTVVKDDAARALLLQRGIE